jgi:ribosome recycling factor
MPINEEVKGDLDKIINKLKEDLSSVRTGRASALIVENIPVEYYGSKVPLKQVAGITIPDARLILVEPWAKENMKDIVSAISAANMGVNPVADATTIKLAFPPLSEEERNKMAKLARERVEKAKISVRLLRDKKREEIKLEEKNKEIGKDEKFRREKELQKVIDGIMEEIEKISAAKEKEVMTV